MKTLLIFLSTGLLHISVYCQSPCQNELLDMEYRIWKTGADSVATRENLIFEKYLFQKQYKDYAAAYKTLKRLEENDTILYEKALMKFLQNDYNLCLFFLNSIDSITRRKNEKMQVLYLVTLIQKNYLTECGKEIIRTKEMHPDSLPPEEPALKPVRKYVHRSAVIPGSGLFFHKKYITRGVWSFTLNAASLACTAILITNGYYGFAGVFGIYPLTRFYEGGKKLTYNKAEQHNNEIKRQLQLEWIGVIFDCYGNMSADTTKHY